MIPISRPSITEREIAYVNDAVSSGWVSSIGKFVDQFEEEFALFCGTRHAVSVANGTVALHLSLVAQGIGPGDEVIVPDLSFIATCNAVLHAGATPVFADIDPYTLCLDPESVRKCLTDNTRAIIPVHLYGHPAPMHELMNIAKERSLFVIEDAAEAHGASIEGRRVGSFGHCGTFSFYGNKNMTTGEGGMITTNDAAFAERCVMLRDHAMDPNKRYWHHELGFNYRLTNIQSALGYAQLERADELLGRRQEIYARYASNLGGHPLISLNRTLPGYRNSYWIICAEIAGLDVARRDVLMANMRARGVDSRPYFYPMSDMPYVQQSDTPVTHDVFQRGLNLPTFVEITNAEIDEVCQVLVEEAAKVTVDDQTAPLSN